MYTNMCFYHSADLDGKCSGAIVKYFIPNTILIPFDYNDEFIWDKIDKSVIVYMVDVSLPSKDMEKLNIMCGDLIYIDHHISKLKELDLSLFKGIQEPDTAACILTWKYFYKKKFTRQPVPKVVDLLGRFDIWDLDETVLSFQSGMGIYPCDPEHQYFWKPLFEQTFLNLFRTSTPINKIISNGRIIRKYFDNTNKKSIMNDAFEFKFRDKKVLAANRTKGNSLLFSGHDQYCWVDILLVFGWIKDAWKVSMYTLKPEIDVSIYCKEFGGGGHKKAAGFYCKELPKEIYDGVFNNIHSESFK